MSIPDGRTLAEEKEAKIASIKKRAHSLLEPTDWVVVRCMENGKDIPTDVLTKRDKIRRASSSAETAIMLCDTLIKLDQCQWMAAFKEQP